MEGKQTMQVTMSEEQFAYLQKEEAARTAIIKDQRDDTVRMFSRLLSHLANPPERGKAPLWEHSFSSYMRHKRKAGK